MLFIGKKIPIRTTFVISCLAVFFTLIAIPIMGFLHIEKYPEIGIPITIVLLIIMGICNAIIRKIFILNLKNIENLINGLAAILGPEYLVFY